MTVALRNNGFTLIELLVVVLIIGILSAIVLPKYQMAVLRSRFSELLSLASTIKNAQEMYFLEHGEYSKDFRSLEIEMPSSGVISADGTTFVLPNNNRFLLLHGGNRIAAYNRTYFCNNYEVILDHFPFTGEARAYCWVAINGGCNTEIGDKLCQIVSGKSAPDANGTTYYIN